MSQDSKVLNRRQDPGEHLEIPSLESEPGSLFQSHPESVLCFWDPHPSFST